MLHAYLEVGLAIGIFGVVVARDTCVVYQQLDSIFGIPNYFHKSLDIFLLADISW